MIIMFVVEATASLALYCLLCRMVRYLLPTHAIILSCAIFVGRRVLRFRSSLEVLHGNEIVDLDLRDISSLEDILICRRQIIIEF